MKKQLLLLAMILLPIIANAQDVYDEDDLLGEWVVNENESVNPYPISEISISDCPDWRAGKGDVYGYFGSYKIYDYFFSSSNRLHIFCETLDGPKVFICKIISFTSEKMIISFKRLHNDVPEYYETVLYKKGSSSVNSITDDNTTSSSYKYNLKGQLLENETDSGVYIQNGKKYVKK